MLNVGELATWAGWIMTIVGMLAFVSNQSCPILQKLQII